jgi:DNA-directed RNA polymerase specialized sigma24 family protein
MDILLRSSGSSETGNSEALAPAVLHFELWERIGMDRGVRMNGTCGEGGRGENPENGKTPADLERGTEHNAATEASPDEARTDVNLAVIGLEEQEDGWASVEEHVSGTQSSKEDRQMEVLYQAYIAAETDGDSRLQSKIFMEIHRLFERQVKKNVRNYRSLSNIHDDEDLLQDSYEGLAKALRNYRKRGRDLPSRKMKFSTFLHWSTTNTFQQDVGSKDKLVEISDEKGQVTDIMEYSDFIKVKKKLLAQGRTHNTVQRIGYIEDMMYEPPFIPQESIEDGFISMEEAKKEEKKK